MNCPDKKINVESKSCLSFNGKGYCKRPDRMRCLEYMKNGFITLSQSSIKAWTCKKKFELSQLFGIEKVGEKPAFKMGNLVDGYITKGEKFEIDDVFAAKAAALCKFIGENFDFSNLNKQVRGAFKLTGGRLKISMFGYLDLQSKDESLIIDVKTSGRPESISNLFTVNDQACAYLLMYPKAKEISFFICRPPNLKQSKKETLIEFATRCYEDICDRPAYYFPKSLDGIGVRYARNEFDLEGYMIQIENTAKEIVYTLNEMEEFQVNREACYSPYTCDYLDLCDAGLNSGKNLPDSYRYRSFKKGRK